MVENKLNTTSFYGYLVENGYYFNKEIVENYLLSLKVKPFVILTGNSGTGKTKLSQLFAKFLANSSVEVTNDLQDYVVVNAPLNFSSWYNQWWTLSSDYFIDIFPLKECNVRCDIVVDDIRATGSMEVRLQLKYSSLQLRNHIEKLTGFNLTDLIDLDSKNKELKKIFKDNDFGNLNIFIDSISLRDFSKDFLSPESSIILKQKSNKTAINERQWSMDNAIFNYLPFKNGWNSCNIIVDNIKSEATIRAVPKLTFNKNDELQQYLAENISKVCTVELKINNFDFDNFESKLDISSEKIIDDQNSEIIHEIVPVGANWTDNTNIIGYYNAITEQYQSTPTYDLINKAKKSNKPYFLILDEMNLSHVERYFADFLSSIESKEPIPIFGRSNESLKLPENLFIIGTVNVDETTYMFSPKVLDRANTIEFETLSVNEYINSNLLVDDFHGNVNYLQSPLMDSNISDLNIIDLKEILSSIECSEGNLLEVLTNEMDSFQYALKSTGFDFGFRVINEILRFMVVAWRYENSPDHWENWERYFDAQIKQKILPKLHGSQKAIGNVLNDLFNLCLIDWDSNEQAKLFDIDETNCKYYTSALKLQNMSKVLSDQRYVSFIN
jgi:tRNA uridine 5-carbamoylmethylation protein Kti12